MVEVKKIDFGTLGSRWIHKIPNEKEIFNLVNKEILD